MPTAISVPDRYSWVLTSAVAASSLSIAHTLRTIQLRNQAKVLHPNAYASAEEAEASPAKYRFNCAQRAHANYAENQPSMVIAMLIAGLRHPELAAGAGVVWTIARSLFLIGYTRGGSAADHGKGRYVGAWWELLQWPMIGLAGWTAWGLS